MANEVTIHVKAKDTASKVMDTIGRTIVRQFTEASTAILKWGGIVATSLPVAAMAIAPVVKWTAQLTTAALAAAPALGFFAVAGLFVKSTMTQIFAEGNKMVKVLEPIGKSFTKAGQEASKAAAEGLAPMVKQFNQLAMPHIQAAMVGIGQSLNGIIKFIMQWLATSEGLQSMTAILGSIEVLFSGISGAVGRVVVSFLAMVGRIAEVSAAAGESGLTRVLHALAEAMDGVNAATVTQGLTDLKIKLLEIKTFILQVVDVVAQIVAFFQRWKTEINLVIDAISILIIALTPVLGPLAAIVAAVSLIVRHWSQLKTAFAGTAELLGPIVAAFQYFWQVVGPAVSKAFQQIKAAVMPVLQQIARQIKSDVIPAIGQFIVAIAPLVAVLVSRLGPVVAAVFRAIAQVISTNIRLGVASLRMMTAIINTVMAAYRALVAAVRGAMSSMSAAVRAGASAVMAVIRGLASSIKGVFAGAGSWLVGPGRALINGLISGIRAAAGAAASAAAAVVRAAAAAARAAIPGLATGGYVGARAAGGGPRGGQVLVGEQGPEIVTLPYGSQVHSNPDSKRMGMGGGGDIYLTIDLGKGIIERLKVHDREIARAVNAGRSGY